MDDQGNTMKVLIADDDPIIRMTYADIISDNGYDVIVCSNGQEAVKQCRRALPDLLILDIHMPELSGPDTVHAIRKLPGGNGIPVIMISGDPADRKMLADTDCFLHKPISMDDLSANIARLIGHKHKSA